MIDESKASVGEHKNIYQQVQDKEGISSPPSADEMSMLMKKSKESYLSVAFMLASNRNRNRPLIKEIENEYLWRLNSTTISGTYPLAVTNAYDYL